MQSAMPRLGLCCVFRKEPIRFRRVTAAHRSKHSRKRQLAILSDVCMHNAAALMAAIGFCHKNGIGGFRINSQILPPKTHPDVGYAVGDLPDGERIVDAFRSVGEACRRHDIRTTFHPDQFILPSSPKRDVTRRSLEDLTYQAEVAKWVGADVINIHGGGAYGDKPAALKRLAAGIRKLPPTVCSRLTLENDDRTFPPADLLPVCRETGVPMVYDVHHHRCLPDGQTVDGVTQRALETWNREPLFHVSSPAHGWQSGKPRIHHDFIDPADFPSEWRGLPIAVEVEAKAKELAVLCLKRDLSMMG